MLTQDRIQFVEARFPHPCPADTSEHRRVFGCPVLFGQVHLELLFSRDVLAWRLPMANPQLAKEMEKVIHAMVGERYQPDRWPDRVIHQIAQHLHQGQKPTLLAVARALAISPRQLQYRLKDEATTFQELLDAYRKETALRYLTAGSLSLGEIACLLRFSEQSAFNHAFKRWTGVSPRQYNMGICGDRKA
jgi:AraC-like DNA-binding protein